MMKITLKMSQEIFIDLRKKLRLDNERALSIKKTRYKIGEGEFYKKAKCKDDDE